MGLDERFILHPLSCVLALNRCRSVAVKKRRVQGGYQLLQTATSVVAFGFSLIKERDQGKQERLIEFSSGLSKDPLPDLRITFVVANASPNTFSGEM